MTRSNITSPQPMISPEALALLGGGKIAYVKTIRSEDVTVTFRRRRSSHPARCCTRCTRLMAPRSC